MLKSIRNHTRHSDRTTLFYFHSTHTLVFVLFSSVCLFYWIFLRATVMVCLGTHCTFEVGSDAGIISWRLPHELVQEVRRRQLRSCPAGGLYLLLTGAQSDITQGGRKSGNKYKEKEKREDLGNSRAGVWVCMRGSSGGGWKKKR